MFPFMPFSEPIFSSTSDTLVFKGPVCPGNAKDVAKDKEHMEGTGRSSPISEADRNYPARIEVNDQ